MDFPCPAESFTIADDKYDNFLAALRPEHRLAGGGIAGGSDAGGSDAGPEVDREEPKAILDEILELRRSLKMRLESWSRSAVRVANSNCTTLRCTQPRRAAADQ